MQFALFKTRSIIFQPPRGHIPGPPRGDRDDDVCKRGPRVIQVVLGRPRRMIRMRMIKPQQVAAQLARAAFRHSIVRRAHEKSAPRPFLGRVRQRNRRRHTAAVPDIPDIPHSPHKGAAAFVRVRLFAMPPNHIVDRRADRDSMTRRHVLQRSRSCHSDISPLRPGRS